MYIIGAIKYFIHFLLSFRFSSPVMDLSGSGSGFLAALALASWLLWLWLPIPYGTHLAMILEALAPGGRVATWEASDLVHVSTAH
jgi:hypothetical protein